VALRGAVLLGVLVVILPWTVRNRLQFGGWFFIRSNFGIELAQANHDGAGPITNTDPRKMSP